MLPVVLPCHGICAHSGGEIWDLVAANTAEQVSEPWETRSRSGQETTRVLRMEWAGETKEGAGVSYHSKVPRHGTSCGPACPSWPGRHLNQWVSMSLAGGTRGR